MTKKVLVFSDWFIPGFKAGGPIRSLVNMIKALPEVSFVVITRIKDYHANAVYPNIEEGKRYKVFDNCNVIYVSEERMNRMFIRECILSDKYDFIYLNSLFSPLFTVKVLWVLRSLNESKAKVIVAPRGMLKTGALSVKAPKKQFFLWLAKKIDLFAEVRWHATSETEQSEIRSVFGSKVEARVAEVLPTLLESRKKTSQKNPQTLRMVCFSRVSPEKGILEAIRIVNSVPNEYSVILDIYGSVPDNDYSMQCAKETQKTSNPRCSLKGEVDPAEIESMYANYDVFLLPTWGENFGHAIAESLMTGTPVIISNKTPWRGLEQQQCGFDLPLEKEVFLSAIKRFAEMDASEFQIWSKNAVAYGRSRALDPGIIQKHKLLFE